ncbi:hypothetical protein K1T35_48175 (plasmid) [Pseudonocardia sp. DSM 110487]|uniref:hypothetical protein n=1 Tax=Pseudonocardia sp. DSM 110487 TaxID=2865833 RepID=UPI001C6959BF|nr:hypothetical protein [Pseudonocardia sp. DSM 110487]QYN41127.1 hypothetical protein K1T35_48175 [Pseudonocardia sp. DSM 110487]
MPTDLNHPDPDITVIRLDNGTVSTTVNRPMSGRDMQELQRWLREHAGAYNTGIHFD